MLFKSPEVKQFMYGGEMQSKPNIGIKKVCLFMKRKTHIYIYTHMYTTQNSTKLSSINIQRVDGLIGTVVSVFKGGECQLSGVAPLRLDCMVYCSNSCACEKGDEKLKLQDDVTFKYDGKVKEAAILYLIILLIMLFKNILGNVWHFKMASFVTAESNPQWYCILNTFAMLSVLNCLNCPLMVLMNDLVIVPSLSV